jgi:tRNA1(Val) A37 N6-methylase TrmN6
MNGLEDQIDLRFVKSKSEDLRNEEAIYEDEPVLLNAVKSSEHIDVVICNPPFFADESSTLSSMTHSEHHT